MGLLSRDFDLCLACKLAFPIDPFNLPKNHIRLCSLLARRLIFGPPLAQNRYHTIRLLLALPLQYNRELVLDRGASATNVLQALFELVVIVNFMIDSSSSGASDMLG